LHQAAKWSRSATTVATSRPTSGCTGREPLRYSLPSSILLRVAVRAGEPQERWAASAARTADSSGTNGPLDNNTANDLDDFEFRIRIPLRLIEKEEVIASLSGIAQRLAEVEHLEDVNDSISRIIASLKQYPIESRELEDILHEFERRLDLVPHTIPSKDRWAAVSQTITEVISAMRQDVRDITARLVRIEQQANPST